MLQCIEPDYTEIMDSIALRRLSRVIKMGSASAKYCLDDAKLATPDTICIGTGKGCYKNTQIFMFSVDDNQEKFVPPSPFIQSSHGSIASQIAIQTGCKNYNMTYSHRSFSFESALLDAMMLIAENKNANVLVGGVDEIEDIQFKTFDRINYYKNPDINNLELLSDKTKGTIAGEGSTFFLLNDRPSDHAYACIQSVHTFTRNVNKPIEQSVSLFLKQNGLTINDLDMVVLGLNGDPEFDQVYYDLSSTLFREKRQLYYKHLCGDYLTSSAFALWASALIAHHQRIPEILNFNDKAVRKVQNILIYNHHRNVNHSLILVSALR
jgi:3-oxoacyl-(acyl-carrier-protein) synthase